ncbi:sigma-70 family RNA polymerase sigma factor [Gimesia maris]|jgi:RNA polymerase sigma-70 factor (ECF subfamily)|nr:sigma-70 family RNA polymerase sigma factor [Gimesia maris]MAC53438.1 RNA polymerase factor sigma-70 [Gimesia sp.]EDL61678.1 probable ECF-like sigma factor SigE [Gimesia maris DSM 8797]QDU13005.1 ECF RNA polymerase sigma factor SigH [Gimesia maris]QEG14933.1 ECF RNA polymerase sigma factor SigH [Gimesia maris]QGQ31690.1 sigma-70 family RNA polymerase sigma factor [Gimesia maris]|tara:strand:- start:209408 stop:209965 length:558 start_codon:yes stop_codon:yes gene_type:complete
MSIEQEQTDLPDELHVKFLHVFTQHRNQIYSYIFSLLPNRDDAEDVFQRTSLILWKKFADYDETCSFFSWACGVAFYEVKNFMRVAQRKRLQFRDDVIQQLADERAEIPQLKLDVRATALEECMQKLKAKDRKLVNQVYRDQIPVKDLAEVAGAAIQTLYNRLNQIRRQLTHCIERTVSYTGEGK